MPYPAIDYAAIDPGIRGLVLTLNGLPGIRTVGSCEGHDDPSETQHALGEWFVSFHVFHTKGGVKSLALLADALNHTGVYTGPDREAASLVTLTVHSHNHTRPWYALNSTPYAGDWLTPEDFRQIVRRLQREGPGQRRVHP